VSPVENVMRN